MSVEVANDARAHLPRSRGCRSEKHPKQQEVDIVFPFERVAEDPAPFAAVFAGAGAAAQVVTFRSLGGDAVLIAPLPRGGAGAYAGIGGFIRRAPAAQVDALWRAVGRAMANLLDDRPLWLSTAGGGVEWLHVRLDRRPKYYLHAPYRAGHAA